MLVVRTTKTKRSSRPRPDTVTQRTSSIDCKASPFMSGVYRRGARRARRALLRHPAVTFVAGCRLVRAHRRRPNLGLARSNGSIGVLLGDDDDIVDSRGIDRVHRLEPFVADQGSGRRVEEPLEVIDRLAVAQIARQRTVV